MMFATEKAHGNIASLEASLLSIDLRYDAVKRFELKPLGNGKTRVFMIASITNLGDVNLEGNEHERESQESNSINPRTNYSVSPDRRRHILEGDGPGKGHGPNRNNIQGAFPDTWTDDQVIDAIERVANRQTSTWKQSTGSGFLDAPISTGGADINAPLLNNKGNPVRFKVRGYDHGLLIEVIVEPNGIGIVTGYVK